jgi:hypothetical protein
MKQENTKLETSFLMLFPYTSCLAGNELLHKLTKNTTASGIVYNNLLPYLTVLLLIAQ